MKICMLTTGHSALDDRIFYKEALSLKKVYNDITIIAPDDNHEYVQDGIRIIGITKPKSIKERFAIVDELIKKAVEVNADVYHFHDFEIIYKANKIKKYLPDAKIVYDVHEHYPDMVRMSRKVPAIVKPLAVWLVDKTELHISKKFSYIITADDAVKERFKTINENTDVVYNFSEFDLKSPINYEKEYDVIYQGGITLERGVFQLVKAIEIARQTKKDIKMIFVGPFGDEEAKKKVFNYIEEKNLNESIKFVGKVPHKDVEGYIRKSKVGVVTLLPLPKYFKNIPIKQFEYMSCGIPVVGSDLPPIKKFLTSYNSGIIVDPTSPKEISEAIIKLVNDPELCEELGNNGIRAVTEEYNWGNMEKKLIKIYKNIEKIE